MAQEWNVDPFIVIIARTRGTIHAPSMKFLKNKLKFSQTALKHTFKAINTIAIQYTGSIILHKRKIENNQPLPIE